MKRTGQYTDLVEELQAKQLYSNTQSVKQYQEMLSW